MAATAPSDTCVSIQDPLSLDSLRAWVKTLPASRMMYPTESFSDRVKYAFWRVYTPFHSIVRDIFVRLGIRRAFRTLGIISTEGRQDFLVGIVAPGRSVKEVIAHLVDNHGYGNHFVAWKDDGQVASLRKSADFRFQYHIRIFDDGEVRGHYEYTPEYRPWRHLREIGQVERNAEFLEILEGHVTPA